MSALSFIADHFLSDAFISELDAVAQEWWCGYHCKSFYDELILLALHNLKLAQDLVLNTEKNKNFMKICEHVQINYREEERNYREVDYYQEAIAKIQEKHEKLIHYVTPELGELKMRKSQLEVRGRVLKDNYYYCENSECTSIYMMVGATLFSCVIPTLAGILLLPPKGIVGVPAFLAVVSVFVLFFVGIGVGYLAGQVHTYIASKVTKAITLFGVRREESQINKKIQQLEVSLFSAKRPEKKDESTPLLSAIP